MTGAAPAVRLDRKEKTDAGQASVPCGADCEDTSAAGEGVRVSLDPGMTLYSLSREYGVPVETIIEANGIQDPSSIRAGTEIYIPTGDPAPPETPAAPPRPTPRKARPKGTEKPQETANLMSIVWPLEGLITGRFGQRGQHHHHDGIDIDGVRGEEVRAVASGVVVRSGSEGKYGKTVVIDHGGGLSTLYAHASRLLVSEGDAVEQGEAIAEVGATGNAHGTHLHFEVRRDGRPVDPLPYLKPEMVGARRSR
jgi:murein DD-endopeptidase MepM/ murein hydrolase activator NlpD